MTQNNSEGPGCQVKVSESCRTSSGVCVVQFSVKGDKIFHPNSSNFSKGYQSNAFVCFIVLEENRSPQQ